MLLSGRVLCVFFWWGLEGIVSNYMVMIHDCLDCKALYPVIWYDFLDYNVSYPVIQFDFFEYKYKA